MPSGNQELTSSAFFGTNRENGANFRFARDWASSIQQQVNPSYFHKEYAISAFHLKQNFVFSYNFELPTFNTFNHAQFDGASSVDGNRPGRVSQVALKLNF